MNSWAAGNKPFIVRNTSSDRRREDLLQVCELKELCVFVFSLQVEIKSQMMEESEAVH